MFLGEFQHSLDAKGRMIVPSKFREDLGEDFVIAKGFEKCMVIYPENEWADMSKKINELPSLDKDVRRLQRFFIGGAVVCEPDNQNRVMIPQNLREYAELDKEIVSIGLDNRIEIWSRENWTTYNEEENYIDDELSDRLANLGI